MRRGEGTAEERRGGEGKGGDSRGEEGRGGEGKQGERGQGGEEHTGYIVHILHFVCVARE